MTFILPRQATTACSELHASIRFSWLTAIHKHAGTSSGVPLNPNYHSFGIVIGTSEVMRSASLLHVAPDSEAEGSSPPVFSAFSGSPFSSGFVAAFLNDCSKSAMISSMCSVPTEIRIRSCILYQQTSNNDNMSISIVHTSVTPELIFSSSLNCSCVVVHG
jgi:hypothetical protein